VISESELDDMVHDPGALQAWSQIPKLVKELRILRKLATAFVENREEATDNIWYCNGKLGRALLSALGLKYVEKS
jgi:hypothetical protein